MKKIYKVLFTMLLIAGIFSALVVKANAVIENGDNIFSSTGKYNVQTLSSLSRDIYGNTVKSNEFKPITYTKSTATATVAKAYMGFITESFNRASFARHYASIIPPYDYYSVDYSNNGGATKTNVGTQAIDRSNSDFEKIVTPPAGYELTHSDAYYQMIDVTDIVNQNGSGNYYLNGANASTTGFTQMGVVFMIVIEEDASFPLRYTAINDFFYSNDADKNELLEYTVNLPKEYTFVENSPISIHNLATTMDYSVSGAEDKVTGYVQQFTDGIANGSEEMLLNSQVPGPDVLNTSLTHSPDRFFNAMSWNKSTFQSKTNIDGLAFKLDVRPAPGTGPMNKTEVAAFNVISADVVKDVELVKTVDKANAQPGDELTYTLNVANDSGFTVYDYQVSDILQDLNKVNYKLESITVDGVAQTDAIDGDQANFTNGKLTVDYANLQNGQKSQIIFKVIVQEAAIGTTITNTASIQDTTDPTTIRETDPVTTDVIGVEQASVIKTVDKATAKPDELLTYTITVANTGQIDLKNYVMTDVLQDLNKVEYIIDSISVDGTAQTDAIDTDNTSYVAGTIAVKYPELSVGQTSTITFKVKVLKGAENSTIENMASIGNPESRTPEIITPPVETKVPGNAPEPKSDSNNNTPLLPITGSNNFEILTFGILFLTFAGYLMYKARKKLF
ncbi:LPXTG cell wall anchor domain-containing protein [Culicoidibacter larvae]|uniref:DUF11 domain-containing protein n=1 Tax=Culicoidibacter larvae TaxID=2579976 RepID=A0A5R8QD69_9FIRM|nr:LPXTG cell wall anchor domain-containing protein [Culicoidibacter larvae]TLG74230.1 DUF11 domain-containing protein [Culicoidibacter larvae]